MAAKAKKTTVRKAQARKSKGPMEGGERQASYRDRHGLKKIDVPAQALKILGRLRRRTGGTNAEIVLAALRLADAQGKDWRPGAKASTRASRGDESPDLTWQAARAISDLVITARTLYMTSGTMPALIEPLRESQYSEGPVRPERDPVIQGAIWRLTEFEKRNEAGEDLDSWSKATALAPDLVTELALYPCVDTARNRRRLIKSGYVTP